MEYEAVYYRYSELIKNSGRGCKVQSKLFRKVLRRRKRTKDGECSKFKLNIGSAYKEPAVPSKSCFLLSMSVNFCWVHKQRNED